LGDRIGGIRRPVSAVGFIGLRLTELALVEPGHHGRHDAVDNTWRAAHLWLVHLEQLQELVRTQPFEPFCLVMANGERLVVPHEDFIWIMPNRRVVQVALPNGASRWVNLQLVAGLEKPVAPMKGAGSKRKNGRKRP